MKYAKNGYFLIDSLFFFMIMLILVMIICFSFKQYYVVNQLGMDFKNEEYLDKIKQQRIYTD